MIAGLILAAGAGTRFAADPGAKLLAELDGRPLLEHAVIAQCGVAALERVVVVLGAGAEEIRRRVAFGRAETVVCPDWARGQSFSLRCGVRALDGCDKLIVTLGDVPRIDPALIARFVPEPPRTRAVYSGRPGHPVVLGPEELREIGQLQGDAGARELVAGGRRIECGEPAAGLDVDNPADLEAMHHEARAVL